jgi:antitoxin MazE
MRARIVRIGNSRGIRIPKALLEEAGLNDEVDLKVQDGTLVIAPVDRPRQGWDEAFAAMALAGDDDLLDAAMTTSEFDEESWEWR